MKYIREFQKIKKKDVPVVGGKGANLGEMFNAGLPVPNGFCITGYAFDEYMKRNSSEKSCSEIASGQIWPELEAEILEYYTMLGENVRVAVRSSATAEDLPEASFAGQQETYLNVIGREELIISIKKCFASLYSDRAVTYRKQANFDKVKVSLAVVIQKMVESEVSGVLFTADPVNQDTNKMMLNASWGLGEGIVSGKVTPDIYTYSKVEKGILNKRLGDKDILICYADTGIEEKKTPAEQKSRFCLSDKEALGIFEMGQKVEDHYGSPQDIEWAIEDGKLYLLQARPITTLNQTKKADNKKTKFSKTQTAALNNWIEHYPSPPYPLDIEPCDIVHRAKSRVFNELGISAESELYMDEEGLLSFSPGKMHISFKIVKVPFIFRKFTNYDSNSLKTQAVFSKIKESLNVKSTVDFTKSSNSDLVKQLKEVMNLSEEIAYVRFRYNIFPSVAVSKLLYKSLRSVDKNINEFDLLSDLPYKTWKMNVALRKLTSYIQEDNSLKEAIINFNIDNKDFIKDIQKQYPNFSFKLDEFLSEFGWKSSSSYCAFGSVSWFEDMTSLFSLVKALLHSDKKDIKSNKYKLILQKIERSFSPKKAAKIRKKIEEIRSYHMNREESLYLIEMCYGLARKIAFEIDHRFPEIFEHPKDILFLKLSEVYSLCSRTKNYKKLVMVRKKNRSQNEILWNSLSLGKKQDDENVLTGVSGNRGICKGRVKKILSLQEFYKMQPGDILVCRYTDPSWTPLFILAAAVVSDTGGPLSHSAIVAREYNIPAVLGCGNATDTLKDGEEIVVDGDEGIVRIKS